LTRGFSLRNDEPALTPNRSLAARPAPPRHDPPSREGRAATVDDVRALLVAYHQRGDQRARARLVELHLPLVRALARRLATRESQLEDLTQVGAIGLIKAIDRFDLARGESLDAFAVPYVAGEIRRSQRDDSWPVRVPRRLQELSGALRQPSRELAARLRRAPTAAELALRSGMSTGDVHEALRAGNARVPVPLPAAETDGGAGPGADELGSTPWDAFEPSDARCMLASGFRVLDERERRILHLRFYAELPQAQIAEHVGLSQIHVSRLIRNGLEKLRAELNEA
jgi:RNA polymerase sigma-B factor